jgi:hypothetical protein
MVTRRRYKRVDPPDVTNVAVVPAQASLAAPGLASGSDDGNPLQRALEAQQHAEELQHQHAHRQQIGLQEPQLDPQQRQQVDAHVESINGLTDHWKRFLKSHPSLLSPPYHASMIHQYDIALRAGVRDNSVDMDRAILIGVARDIEHHHHLSQLTSASARPTPENAQMHDDASQAAADLQAEAEQHLAAHQPAPTAPPPKRKSMPMSAPVSRDAPMVSGRPAVDNHLTADERQIAHNSFTDPNMSKAQKEYLYLQNKRKLRAAREDGSYSEQRG